MRRFVLIVAFCVVATTAATAAQRYAVIDSAGNVVNVILGDQSYSPPQGYSLVQSDVVGPGWKWSQNGGFVPPPSTPPTGLQIVSTSTPMLNGIYAIDPPMQQKVQAISLYIAVNGKFPAGQTVQSWPDVNATMHQFQTTTQWQAFATAMGDFVAAVDLGQTPVQPITIP